MTGITRASSHTHPSPSLRLALAPFQALLLLLSAKRTQEMNPRLRLTFFHLTFRCPCTTALGDCSSESPRGRAAGYSTLQMCRYGGTRVQQCTSPSCSHHALHTCVFHSVPAVSSLLSSSSVCCFSCFVSPFPTDSSLALPFVVQKLMHYSHM